MLIDTMPKPSRKTTVARLPQSPKAARIATVTAPAAAANGGLDQVFAVVARYFGMLSEPTRLKILHTICQDEQSVTAIVAATGATQTNVSRHLALMLAAGVVSRRRAGNVAYYRVAEQEVVNVCRTVCMQIASRIDDQKPLKRDLRQFAAGH
jgi:DNA-binding transcriptional ArsR family regulator